MAQPIINAGNVHEIMTSVRFGSDEAVAAVDGYIEEHLPRFVRTLQAIPPAPNDGSLLDAAGLANLVPCYFQLLNYKHVTITSADKDSPFVPHDLGETLKAQGDVNMAYFNLEFERFPFPDNTFDTVVCCEVLEHMTVDPMALMSELNRVCKEGGTLVLTTPNIVSWRCLLRAIAGEHPISFNNFSGMSADRHNREYTPAELSKLLPDAGFDPLEITTFDLQGLQQGHRWLRWCVKPLGRFFVLPPEEFRGDFILAKGTKISPVRNRMPNWLYGQFKEDRQLMAQAGKYDGPVI